ncbi:Ubiquitin-protein ligase [Pseudoloma neurophilia]|uniref:Ubiquitin-protein ligase n=1 Tax=Pseudoloma neurophilia TaxID=146866 RepID=A0A0R0M0B5_9MICR|nr:Ubiquitin-protein ligase [Pseudoloma neurophilia]
MSTPAKRRLLKDLKELQNTKNKTVFASPLDEDILTWCAVILGPKDTPFENATFSMSMEFDESYPTSAPNCQFMSKVYHPNIYTNGDLCLDILSNRWSPNYSVTTVLLSVQSMLNDPNISSPANLEAANDFENNKKLYHRRVRDCVEKSWYDLDKMKEQEQ